MSKIKKTNSNSTIKISRNAAGLFRVQPDKRDFRGGFQPRSTSVGMPRLPKSGSSVHVVTNTQKNLKPKQK